MNAHYAENVLRSMGFDAVRTGNVNSPGIVRLFPNDKLKFPAGVTGIRIHFSRLARIFMETGSGRLIPLRDRSTVKMLAEDLESLQQD